MLSLHDQLRAIVTQAFPAGIPLAKKTYATVASGGYDHPPTASEVYEVYNRCTDKYFELTVSLNIDDELKIDCAIPAGDDYDKNELLIISQRLHAAKEKPEDPEITINLHKFLNGLAQAIGSQKGFGEKAPNDKRPYFTYMAYGPGGRVMLTCDLKEYVFRVNYRSGPSKRDDRINMVDFEHAANYTNTIEKAAGVSKVWHRGAVEIVQDYLNILPVRSFRLPVQERPSYQYDFPFCDIVSKEFPDVCLLRVTHEGFKMWRDGSYITVTDISQLETAPVLQEIEGFPQTMWRLGSGILYTTGSFSKTAPGKLKFTPSSRG